MLPSAWHLSIITDGCASSDWLPGPMLICVHLGDVCIVIGSFLMFLVFFVYVLIRKVGHICFIITDIRLDPDGELLPTDHYTELHAAVTR